MKLIPLIIWMANLFNNNEAHESFTFPPQFQGLQPGPFSTDRQLYLPLETQTAIPYFPMKNFNKLQFSYLPPTVTKLPPGSPSPFPVIRSTTLLPMTSDEDDDDDEDNASTPLPQYARNQYNRTQVIQNNPKSGRREIRPIGKTMQNPIDRIDAKLPFQFDSNYETKTQNAGPQLMQPRSIVISDIQRDHNFDQMKTSFQGTQYLPQPGAFISTTETAIPILRLSNEMDLDGSFSYEALGADQTHYVQHSRMENIGADKEEQVVEGSYSYVGDNGKTYTVHYIADSNGFRASGDHLPVPPPVPEIIQRAVQYNLAEELKKPPHLKSWKEEENENEVSDSEKLHRFAVLPPRLSSLFTGKTPESFSHSFSQNTNSQNNLIAAASSQIPIHAMDFTDQLQNNQNSGTISPQITFVASQGAHVPSANTAQQHNTGRTFTTERPALPQIVNYEAEIKDTEKDSNKGLWRWQYGINSNTNQNMNKNLISRSSGDDDVSINFSDMTADDYTKMIHQQFIPNGSQTSETPHENEVSNSYKQHHSLKSQTNSKNEYQMNNNYYYNTENPVTIASYYPTTQKNTPSTITTDWYKSQSDYNQLHEENINNSYGENSQTSRPKLVTQDQFVPRSQTVTQTYNYDNNEFESRRTRYLHKNPYNMDLKIIPLSHEKSIQTTTPEINTEEPVLSTTNKNLKFTDFIVPEDKGNFKPIFPELQFKESTTTTEANIESMLERNIFLKHIFTNNKNNQESTNKMINEIGNLPTVKPIVDTKNDKYPSPTFRPQESKPLNDINTIKMKASDMADIMNYLSRNQFESNKVRSKPNQVNGNVKQKYEMQYVTSSNDPEMTENQKIRNYRTLQEHVELPGAIKNYKVLQRHHNLPHTEHDNSDGPKRGLSPSRGNLPSLGRPSYSINSYIPMIYE